MCTRRSLCFRFLSFLFRLFLSWLDAFLWLRSFFVCLHCTNGMFYWKRVTSRTEDLDDQQNISLSRSLKMMRIEEKKGIAFFFPHTSFLPHAFVSFFLFLSFRDDDPMFHSWLTISFVSYGFSWSQDRQTIKEKTDFHTRENQGKHIRYKITFFFEVRIDFSSWDSINFYCFERSCLGIFRLLEKSVVFY